MKKIGTIENDYHIYQKSPKTFLIQFEVGGHTISLEDFKYCEWMSEETNCFRATLVVDGKNIGEAYNEGHGGNAYYHCLDGKTTEETQSHYALVRDVSRLIEEVEDYCFPKHKRSLCDVLDGLAAYILTFQENNVATLTKAKAVISYLQERADMYRERYGK